MPKTNAEKQASKYVRKHESEQRKKKKNPIETVSESELATTKGVRRQLWLYLDAINRGVDGAEERSRHAAPLLKIAGEQVTAAAHEALTEAIESVKRGDLGALKNLKVAN